MRSWSELQLITAVDQLTATAFASPTVPVSLQISMALMALTADLPSSSALDAAEASNQLLSNAAVAAEVNGSISDEHAESDHAETALTRAKRHKHGEPVPDDQAAAHFQKVMRKTTARVLPPCLRLHAMPDLQTPTCRTDLPLSMQLTEFSNEIPIAWCLTAACYPPNSKGGYNLLSCCVGTPQLKSLLLEPNSNSLSKLAMAAITNDISGQSQKAG